jgi:hypothetical protein
MTKPVCLAIVGALLLLAAPAAEMASGQGSSLDRAIRDLEGAILLMDGRLERLEAIAAMDSPRYARDIIGDGSGSAASSRSKRPKRVMQLDGVETLEPDEEGYRELERLRRDVEALERQVDSQKKSASSSMSSGGNYGSYRSNRVNRRARGQSDLLADYQRQLKQKRGQMKKMEREIKEPKQLILGNGGGKVITLRTTADLSRTLNRIDTGSYLTWEGRRVREDEDSQEWVALRITPVDEHDIR